MARKKKTKKLWLTLAIVLIALVLRHWSQTSSSGDQIVHTDHAKHSRDKDLERSSTPSPPRPSSVNADPDMPAVSSRIHDFDSAKFQLKKLFGRGREFYCNCSYDLSRSPAVDPSSCGLVSKSVRAKRIEWEHVVPASYYGRQFASWKRGDPVCTGREKKGRECARRASPGFRQIESDMYNLVPAVGELNRVRSDTSYGMVPGEPREYGACDFESFAKLTEPRPEIRGDIARIYFYMDARYPQFQIVNASNQRLLEEWADYDPLDETEMNRLRKIEGIQGNSFFIGRLSSAQKKQDAQGL